MSAEQRCSCSNCACNQPIIESATTEPKAIVQTDRRQPRARMRTNLCHAMWRGEARQALHFADTQVVTVGASKTSAMHAHSAAE